MCVCVCVCVASSAMYRFDCLVSFAKCKVNYILLYQEFCLLGDDTGYCKLARKSVKIDTLSMVIASYSVMEISVLQFTCPPSNESYWCQMMPILPHWLVPSYPVHYQHT